jgi:tetratricopeptide (TPR) repeat protein
MELVKQDRYPDALCECAVLIKEDPTDLEVIRLTAFLFGRIQEGNLDFHPETGEQFVMRGIAKFYNGDITASIEDYKAALVIQPNNDYAHKSLSFSYRFLGKYQKAIFHIEHAIALKPIGEYFDNLGDIYDLTGETKLARLNYEKAVEVSPNEFRLWYNLGVHLMENGLFKEALEKYNKSIELWPHFEDAKYNRDWILNNCEL